MIRTTNHHCVDLIIAHLKRIYNFPFANRLQRRGGRKQIEISTVQNCHSYSIYYWVFFFFQFLIFNNWPSEKWLSRIHLHYKGSSILPLDDRIRTLLQLYSTNLETMDASSKKSVSHVVSFVSLQRRQPKTPLEQSMMISLGCLSNGIPWYVSWGFWFCGLFWFLVLADDFQPWIKIWICDLEKKISVCIYRWELLWSSYLKYFEWWRGKWSWDMDYEEHMELSSNLQLRFETANIIVSIRWQTLVCPTNIRK